jgi:hypothetical protein
MRQSKFPRMRASIVKRKDDRIIGTRHRESQLYCDFIARTFVLLIITFSTIMIHRSLVDQPNILTSNYCRTTMRML